MIHHRFMAVLRTRCGLGMQAMLHERRGESQDAAHYYTLALEAADALKLHGEDTLHALEFLAEYSLVPLPFPSSHHRVMTEKWLRFTISRLGNYEQLSCQLDSASEILFPEVPVVWRRDVLETMRSAFSCTACHKDACNCLVQHGCRHVSVCAQHSTILQCRVGSLTSVQMCSHCW